MNTTHDHAEHILPLWIYFSVAGALFALTIITVAVAQYDFGSMNIIVAMAVAAPKGSLVALFFMHLKYDNKLYASFFVGSLVFLATFIIFTMFDTETRGRIYEDVNYPINERAVIYDTEGAPLKANPHGEHGEAAAHDSETGTMDHPDESAPAEEGAAATDGQSEDSGTAATESHAEPDTGGGH